MEVMKWQTMKAFCDENFPGQKFKDAQRKSFLVKRGLRIQKDEKGIEGVAMAKDGQEGTKEIKVGKRFSAAKIRQEDFGDGTDFSKEAREAAHIKNTRNLNVQSNSKAGLSVAACSYPGSGWSAVNGIQYQYI